VSDLQRELAAILRQAAQRLREGELPAELAERLEELAKQVHQPCVVAVVGRVKVGKSTFVNALLGEDLAKVGTAETTATINYFTYGNPNPNLPVRCHWRGGKVTDESREFLDGLQGNDLETLRQADGIDHLEYFLPNPVLKQITLVDTPGTGAVVEEHQDRTAEFMQLNNQLRDRHDRETRRLGDTADAVIYLVGQVAKVTDKAFLQEFAQTTGGESSALNAVGILSKIELQPEVLAAATSSPRRSPPNCRTP
jgi:Dynamin family